MKIIQIMPEFGLAGAEIMAENLSYGLSNLGHEVVIVSFYNMETEITKRLLMHGFKLIYLDKVQGFDKSIITKLRKIFSEEKPAVVHTHRYVLPYVFAASIGMPIKIIHTVHNIATKEVGSKQQILQKIIFHSKKVTPVAISPIVKKSILERYDLREDQVPMIFNGIDLERCIPKAEYNLHEGGTILHIGRFTTQKNHNRLIDAYEKVHHQFPQIRLKLIGSGELLDDIKKSIVDKGLESSVEFLGLQGNVYPFMNAADIFCLSSDYEGMPITLIEAMGTGLPIVSTNVGGIPDMIENGVSGQLVGLSDEELSTALVNYLKSKTLREKHGIAAKQKSTIFSQEDMTMNYLGVY